MGVVERFHERTYHPVHRKWPKKARKAVWWLMPLELIGLVPCLVIFGLAQPNLYRTQMWQIGWDHRLNSDPNMIIYAYSNGKPLPKVPLIWSSVLTEFNVAISVISLFFLLTKLVAFIMKYWFPVFAVFVNTAMVALYTVSVYGQIGPDHADKRYPAPAAWYFRFGCDMAKSYGAYGNCRMAQGSLAITLYMLVIYILSLGFAIWAMVPHPRNDVGDYDDDDDDDDDDAPSSNGSDTRDRDHELQNMKGPVQVSSVPFTPRTQAFHTLDRRLPLRATEAPDVRSARFA